MLVVVAGVKKQVGERTVMVHTLADVFYLFQKKLTAAEFECAPNRVNVFEIGITLPGHSEMSLVVST